ncbi:polyprenyl synthetase family protein [Streptomyces sp. SID4919]|uniref:polyprenyl synthetase family protein n=1 Tax=unclassified Streptomyces TaxID=2593676 RepID=UPI00082389FE|nr:MULTISPECIES: polyprenyl synthetase family protein [unclassified Streptomyces]MYY09638.1 polyprenyl synthetase family protein [Streptomyces sp. SID4919]SCK35153.1 geranylgeranyl diphosphate synthase, type I [Streptomyces sp. AmelKG-E11A]
MTEARDCPTILAQTATAVGPLLRSRVCRLPERIRHVCGLHFGWWTEHGTARDAPETRKLLRPALTLLACQAVGGQARAAHPAAVAVELIHNAGLLHDDIIDQDPLRRGRPALWATQGVPAAILAGDALFFAAVQALVGAPGADVSVPVLLDTVQVLIEGEYRDVLLETGADREHEALQVAAGKTAVLLACACELGAAAGGADPERVRHLRAFGHHLGIAFQCADDLLGIWGDPGTTGKPARSDLRHRKVSLPVAAAMAQDSPPARHLRELYRARTPLGDDDCARAADLIEQTGAREATERRALDHVADALRHLDRADPSPVPAAELSTLAHLVVHRDR